MAAFGPDFRDAKSNWLYQAENKQAIWFAVLMAVLLVALQLGIPAIVQMVYLIGSPELIAMIQKTGSITPEAMSGLIMPMLITMIPGSLFVTWLATRAAKADKQDWRLTTAFHFPALGWAGWFVVVAIFFVTTAFVGFLIRVATADLESIGEVEKAVMQLRDAQLAKFVIPISIGLAAPVAEEFLFRGALFSKLLDTRLGRWGTVILTSAAWAIVHVTQPWVTVLQIFVMGLVLGALLLRFGSIWVCIVCHCLWNLMTVVFLFNADLPGISSVMAP